MRMTIEYISETDAINVMFRFKTSHPGRIRSGNKIILNFTDVEWAKILMASAIEGLNSEPRIVKSFTLE